MVLIWNAIEEDYDKEVVLTWYFGKVVKIMGRKRNNAGVVFKCTAAIERETGGSTLPQELSEETFVGLDNALGVNSWMQV